MLNEVIMRFRRMRLEVLQFLSIFAYTTGPSEQYLFQKGSNVVKKQHMIQRLEQDSKMSCNQGTSNRDSSDVKLRARVGTRQGSSNHLLHSENSDSSTLPKRRM